MKNAELTLSIDETAMKLGISRNLCYLLARQGKLPGCFELGHKRLRVSRVALARFLEEAGSGKQ